MSETTGGPVFTGLVVQRDLRFRYSFLLIDLDASSGRAPKGRMCWSFWIRLFSRVFSGSMMYVSALAKVDSIRQMNFTRPMRLRVSPPLRKEGPSSSLANAPPLNRTSTREGWPRRGRLGASGQWRRSRKTVRLPR